jgi:hypothetical protein
MDTEFSLNLNRSKRVDDTGLEDTPKYRHLREIQFQFTTVCPIGTFRIPIK